MLTTVHRLRGAGSVARPTPTLHGVTTPAICDRCGTPAEHLFPGDDPAARICSNCYQALQLHQKGARLVNVGYGAIAVGAALIVAVLLVILLAG
jgi:hypothetical protein